MELTIVVICFTVVVVVLGGRQLRLRWRQDGNDADMDIS